MDEPDCLLDKPAPLTKRENEVVRLVVQGLANKSVALQLGLCEGTVKLHLHRIYRKLKVPNRTGLALYTVAGQRRQVTE